MRAALAGIERALLRPGARDVTGLAAAVPGQFARLAGELAAAGRARGRVGLVTGVTVEGFLPPRGEHSVPDRYLASLQRVLAEARPPVR